MDTPQPDSRMPSDISQGRDVLSAIEPKSGWISEPTLLSAKVSPAAAS